ncbi:hypothetical protein CRUP_028440, partial [Coryphaenoides rupestris]
MKAAGSRGSSRDDTSAPHDADEETSELCPGFKDVDAFVKYGLGAVVSATKASAALPQPGDDFDFYRSFPGFREFCENRYLSQHKQHLRKMYKPLADTACSFLNTLEDLVALNETLGRVTEFAVDLEHHSYRTFQGLTCLMQISTREQDYIIDTLELRSELYLLNEVFTNPAIVKVFHGADSDVEWLQKDLGLYLVTMFDTHQASRALNHARHSLDHLLKQLCGVDSDKRFQLADWRIRPLPDEMFEYARADTHTCCTSTTASGGSCWTCSTASRACCRASGTRKYAKPIFTEESYQELLRRQKRAFNTQQLAAFRLLYAWRDKLARQEDESTGYVLPNHMLIKVAEELPKETQGIIACCNPVPPLVRQQVNELHLLVQQAREMPLLKAEIVAQKKKGLTPIKKVEGKLFGPHDTSRTSESDGSVFLPNVSFSELPVKKGSLFSEEELEAEMDVDTIGLVARAKVTIFEDTTTGEMVVGVAKQKASRIIESFQNPFRMISQRWKLQSVEQQQKELEAKKAAREKSKEQTRKATEERKKAKLDYQGSLKNVRTVRQQV